MGRVGMFLDLVAEFVMGRVCQGSNLSLAEFALVQVTRMIQSSNYVLSVLHRRLDPSLIFSLQNGNPAL